VG
ncbi:hypothetical protein CP02DC15_1126B, partial [Chlamydia psittaci 02DC15]|jgi:hypothetical protein